MNQTRLLGGRYQLGELLGYGGMAEVHRGRDQRLGRDVAIKVLRADLARDAGFQARFKREAQNAAALNHPAIVAVYDTGEDETPDGTLPYIVMEYVEGRTLKEVLTAEQRIMPQRAMEIVADICAALDFSHRHGIVHRDIKPGNVMLTRTGAVKVMDFGIARALTSNTATMTQTSAVIGTAAYLSPEQARGEAVDARSDVYSTGCLLYELMVGQPPFTGDNPVSVAYQHVREDPIPPSEINPDVTRAMDAVVLRAMAKNPINRYQSAGEMRADLLRAAAGRAVLAPAILPSEERTQVLAGATRPFMGADELEPLEPPRKSRKAMTWALIALGLIAVFALAAFATSQLLDKTPKVTVPSVVGKTEAEARARLTDMGFAVRSERVTSSEADKGKVIDQNPASGKEADKGSQVVLEIGAGPETTTVPDLDNLDREGAERLLDNAGLAANFVDVDSAKPAGAVVAYSPGKDETVPKGTKITVRVSKGNLRIVPDVVGKDAKDADAELRDAGLKVSIAERANNTVREGTVLDQNPAQGREVPQGTLVTIYVAQRTEPSASPSLPTVTPSTTLSLR